MVRRKDDTDPDRYLMQKRGIYYYQRRIPLHARARDRRGPLVRISLETKDIAAARRARDRYEDADDQMWASIARPPRDPEKARYDAAVARVEAMGLTYRSAAELGNVDMLELLLERIDRLSADGSDPVAIEMAVLGGVPKPPMRLSKVRDLYLNEIAADEIRGKSEQQRRKWRNVKTRAVAGFIAIAGDKEIERIDREDALKVWRHWQLRIAPSEPGEVPTHTASSGNRDVGALRTIYDAYYRHMGDRDRVNPFAGLSFKERGAKKRLRPPFAVEWIRDRIMRPGALETMNQELRGILLAEIELGARPSEIVNLFPESIRPWDEVPHIIIQPRDDPEDPRELKTEQSERVMPLVGVALAVFREFPHGFPRYREREESASGAINKYLRENQLMPTPRHTLYGLRHALEDRMKEAGLDAELRKLLMGHIIDREMYGTGGSLKWRAEQLAKIALPFDPTIVTTNRGPPPARRGPARRTRKTS